MQGEKGIIQSSEVSKDPSSISTGDIACQPSDTTSIDAQAPNSQPEIIITDDTGRSSITTSVDAEAPTRPSENMSSHDIIPSSNVTRSGTSAPTESVNDTTSGNAIPSATTTPIASSAPKNPPKIIISDDTGVSSDAMAIDTPVSESPSSNTTWGDAVPSNGITHIDTQAPSRPSRTITTGDPIPSSNIKPHFTPAQYMQELWRKDEAKQLDPKGVSRGTTTAHRDGSLPLNQPQGLKEEMTEYLYGRHKVGADAKSGTAEERKKGIGHGIDPAADMALFAELRRQGKSVDDYISNTAAGEITKEKGGGGRRGQESDLAASMKEFTEMRRQWQDVDAAAGIGSKTAQAIPDAAANLKAFEERSRGQGAEAPAAPATHPLDDGRVARRLDCMSVGSAVVERDGEMVRRYWVDDRAGWTDGMENEEEGEVVTEGDKKWVLERGWRGFRSE